MKKKLYIETSVWYSGKAVEEVGQWREALGKELENISFDKRSEYLNKQGMEIYNKYYRIPGYLTGNDRYRRIAHDRVPFRYPKRYRELPLK